MARTTTSRTKQSVRKVSGKSKQTLASLRKRPLRDFTEEALRQYFKELNGHKPGDLYGLVIGEVERPLFVTVMDYTHGNQTQAAEILGMTRATLRKKLKQYDLLS
jgi:Fis family transcriptional regulator